VRVTDRAVHKIDENLDTEMRVGRTSNTQIVPNGTYWSVYDYFNLHLSKKFIDSEKIELENTKFWAIFSIFQHF
jgi:hypothetical protein